MERPFVFSTVLSLREKTSREDFHHLKNIYMRKKSKKIKYFLKIQ